MACPDDELVELIESLIETGREDDWWDFKECHDKDKASLLHDIICLANNRADRDSYLIIGVRDKTFEIVGVENDTNRKNQQWMVDFLSSKNFAGQLRPRVEVRTIQLSGHEIDVFIIKNSTDVPYYLLKDYTDKDYKNHKRKTVHASHIYTRVMDNNTHADQTADIRDVEYLWKKRFGLLQTPLEQVKILLHQFDDWAEEDGIYYHKTFPQYTITLEDEEDEDGLCREGNRMFYHHVQTDNSAYYGTIKIHCFGTQLFSCQFTHLDGHRMMAPCPESRFIPYWKYGETIFMKYYVTDSILYLLLKFLEYRIGNQNGSDAQWATKKLLDVVLVFNSESELDVFSDYIATHLDIFDTTVSNQRDPYIRDETDLAKKVLTTEIRNSLALKELQIKFEQKIPEDY